MLTAYTLDRHDRITAVDAGWDVFALENGGEGACAQHVVGGRLVDAIAGDPVRMFMTAILMRVRASGVAESVPYRCDSDRVKRHYTMTLSPLANGAIRVEHHLDREEPSDLRIRIRPAVKGRSALFRCSVCCRVREEDAWRDLFDGERDRDIRVIHTVCEDCKASPMSGFRHRTPRPIHVPPQG